ncbi:MAG: hypothetical protein DMG15_19100 [Acidobacteria bacterium]|nr:MAG: hypothetical protein DMG15_19100 [Acidobacteriota bacterium]
MFRLFSRKNLERIKYVWGSGRIWGGSQVQHWLEHPLVQERINLKVSGTARLNRLDEFIGPSRFQWTDAQIQTMNEQLQQLPKHLRRLISDQSKFKERIVRKTVAYMAAADPSEAVRSLEIVPLLAQYFRILEVKGYGGAILHELLYDIAGNFCEEHTGSLDYLRRLFETEDQLTASQKIRDDFPVIIVRSREA